MNNRYIINFSANGVVRSEYFYGKNELTAKYKLWEKYPEQVLIFSVVIELEA